MPASRPVRLPDGFTAEPATAAHTEDVYPVTAAEMTEAFGFSPLTEDDVRADLGVEPPTVTMQWLVRERATGAPVQWWAVMIDPGDPTFHLWVRTHPRLPDPVRDEVAAAGFSLLLHWVREHASDGQQGVRVQSGCPASGDAGRRHLQGAGFAHERTFWEMVGDVTEARRAAVPVAGLELGRADDLRPIHRILDDSFAGHYGHEPRGFDDWLAFERSYAGYDPELWVLARIDGEPAGVLQMTCRAQALDQLYVAEIATVERFRRRGIASALLAHAFDVAAVEGLAQVSLHVDSDNAHAAPAVYRSAGFEVRTSFHAYARNLTT